MSKYTKAVSDEEIVAALLKSGTVEAAARAAGCSTRTIYDRLRESKCKGLYLDAKTDILRGAVLNATKSIDSAMETTLDIMRNPSTPPAVRLQAAQNVVNNALKMTQYLTDNEARANSANHPLNQLDIFGLLEDL